MNTTIVSTYEKLLSIQIKNNSMLCIGLDTDIDKLPDNIEKNCGGIIKFNRKIIEATSDLVCAYKINFAFYEQYGIEGIKALKTTMEMIPENIISIADAKRGDIGNTSKAYAKSCYDYFNADSITVNPYMGFDSIKPFLDYKDKLTFILAVTSNKGSLDFQRLVNNGKQLFRIVIEKSKAWGNHKNLAYVVGATHPDLLRQIRKIIPKNIILIPGIGAQGGSIEDTVKANSGCPAIINVSRGIIYASDGNAFAEHAREKAEFYKTTFNDYN